MSRSRGQPETTYKGKALSIDTGKDGGMRAALRGVECEIREFEVPYDDLIVSIGADSTPGSKLPNCLFANSCPMQSDSGSSLATHLSARRSRSQRPAHRPAHVCCHWRRADRRRALWRARDFVAQDVPRHKGLQSFVRVILLEASDKVLMAFDGDLQDAALRRLRSNEQGIAIDVRLSAGVKEVTAQEILLSDGSSIRYALSLWAAGIGTLDFVKDASAAIPEQAAYADQARGRLAVDSWLRVVGLRGTPIATEALAEYNRPPAPRLYIQPAAGAPFAGRAHLRRSSPLCLLWDS